MHSKRVALTRKDTELETDLESDLSDLADRWRAHAAQTNSSGDRAIATVLDALGFLANEPDQPLLDRWRSDADRYMRTHLRVTTIPTRRELAERLAWALELYAKAGDRDPKSLGKVACAILENEASEDFGANDEQRVVDAIDRVNRELSKQGKSQNPEDLAERWTRAIFRALRVTTADTILSGRNRERAPAREPERSDVELQETLAIAGSPEMVAERKRRAEELACRFPRHTRRRSSR